MPANPNVDYDVLARKLALPDPESVLLTTGEMSVLTGRPIPTLDSDRHLGKGLPYVKLAAKAVRYKLSEYKKYVAAREVEVS